MKPDRIKHLQTGLTHPILIKKQENLLYLTGHLFLYGYLLIKKDKVVFFGDGLEKLPGVINETPAYFAKYIRPNATLEVEDIFTWRELNYLKKKVKGIKVRPALPRVEQMRLIKSGYEIEQIRKAVAITDRVFQTIKKGLKRHRYTETELARQIRILGLEYGADDVSFAPIAASGANAAVPHHKPTTKILKTGESIVLDFGFKVNGYCSDFTRTVFLKRVPKKMETVYLAVQQARFNALRNARAGITGGELDQFARGVLEKAKLGKYFIHSLGHGTGLEIHEAPSVSARSKDILENGNVFSIEPGVYLSGVGGVRLEDLVYLDKGRIKFFVKTPTALEENIIK